MTTCIRCRQEHSETDHECIKEMSLEELYEPSDEMVSSVTESILTGGDLLLDEDGNIRTIEGAHELAQSIANLIAPKDPKP
jgi:hypothetical protein